MSRRLLFVSVLAALPALVCAQGTKLVNCRTLEAAGNFVGSDEVVVNDMVCQKAKPGANAFAPFQVPKPLAGVVISDTDSTNVVDAAKAASKRVSEAKEAIKEKAAEEAAVSAPKVPAEAVPPAKAPEAAVTAAPAEAAKVSEPIVTSEPVVPNAKAETNSAAKVASEAAAAAPNAVVAAPAEPVKETAPVTASAPGPTAPAKAADSNVAPVAAAPTDVSAGDAVSSFTDAVRKIVPAEQVTGTPPGQAAPAEVATPAARTAAPGTAAGTSAEAHEPAAAASSAPATSETAPAAPSTTSAPAVAEAPRAVATPAASGTGFYDANAGVNVITNPRPEDAAKPASASSEPAPTLATHEPALLDPRSPAAQRESEAREAAAAKAAAEEAQAAMFAPDPNAPRERVVETGAFKQPEEVGPDPSTLAHKTTFQPGDSEGFEEGHRSECTKNITIGGLKGEKLVLGTPGWAGRWIEKNQKRMPQVCFSDTPMTTAKNYLIVFYTAAGQSESAEATKSSATPQGAPAGGVGAFTLSYGSTWHYAQERSVGVTVLTRDEADQPQSELGKVWYATAYTEEGVPVSEHWPEKPKKPVKLEEKDLKTKKGREARAEMEHVSDELLEQMVEDIAKF